MKYILCAMALAISLVLISTATNGQGMAINTTGSAADASAILDVKSTAQGMLVPRMTSTQRTGISSPATGLLVYDITLNSFYFNSGNPGTPVWTAVGGSNLPTGSNGQVLQLVGSVPTWVSAPAPSLYVGMRYQGGVIAYILQSGDLGYSAATPHGLIAATSDQSSGSQWGCYGTSIGTTGTAIGTGAANTTAILLAGCTTSGNAVQLCHAYNGGGYTDWYLPSLNELNTLYINQNLIGGFASGVYWSSSEYNAYGAWNENVISDYQTSYPKGNTYYVRAVRSF